LFIAIEPRLEELKIAGDHQKIVEVVRDTLRELRNTFQLLCLCQSSLGFSQGPLGVCAFAQILDHFREVTLRLGDELAERLRRPGAQDWARHYNAVAGFLVHLEVVPVVASPRPATGQTRDPMAAKPQERRASAAPRRRGLAAGPG
jgi:hypothetical protein